MRKILIYDIAAEFGGALTVLNSYYDNYRNNPEYESYFITSVVKYPENDRVHIIKLPWTKKSWIHRLFCDYVYMPGLLKRLNVDEVLSLQNIGLRRCQVPQTVYVQNAIPFTEHKFTLLKDPFLWVYQNIIGSLTYNSLKHVDSIIVQTVWMKDEIVKKCGIKPEIITVQRVKPTMKGDKQREITKHAIFFYPAAPYRFKNHDLIMAACKRLKEEKISDYEVVFTIGEGENKISSEIAKEVMQHALPIFLVGKIDKEQMMDYYKKSILLFPSYLETVGLPLIEAQEFDAPILASNCAFAHEAIGSYSNCKYFDPLNSEELACKMIEIIKSQS